MRRTLALLGKELEDLRANPAVFFPAVFTGALAITLPFVVAVVIPAMTGERLSDSSDFEGAVRTFGNIGLDPEAAAQAWVFRQFLLLLVLSPIAASMSVAAHSIVGEKQARTLEPLLATPVTTVELLAAKTLGAMLPTLALTLLCFLAYLGGVLAFARPGVSLSLLAPVPLAIMFVVGPLAALAALQMAVCVSSRVNDPRGAQQLGALVILPISALLVAQLVGAIQLTGQSIAVIALVLAAVNAGLMRLAVRLFDRESILTRWT